MDLDLVGSLILDWVFLGVPTLIQVSYRNTNLMYGITFMQYHIYLRESVLRWRDLRKTAQHSLRYMHLRISFNIQ